MSSPFAVRFLPRYRRLSAKLLRGHRDFEVIERRAASILSADPFNLSRSYHVKKLENVPAGEGQYRLALGRWRFRYDVLGQIVGTSLLRIAAGEHLLTRPLMLKLRADNAILER